jgi:ribosome-associated protein
MIIPEDEIWFSFSRSGGPGGQNVNKVSSKVTLHWASQKSLAFSDAQKLILSKAAVLRSFIDREGIVSFSCQISRSQLANRKVAIARLYELVALALVPKKRRKKTKTPRGQIEKRLKQKKTRGQRLQRRRVSSDD